MSLKVEGNLLCLTPEDSDTTLGIIAGFDRNKIERVFRKVIERVESRSGIYTTEIVRIGVEAMAEEAVVTVADVLALGFLLGGYIEQQKAMQQPFTGWESVN